MDIVLMGIAPDGHSSIPPVLPLPWSSSKMIWVRIGTTEFVEEFSTNIWFLTWGHGFVLH